MKKLLLSFGVFISALSLRAQVEAPVLSAESGFYENEFTLTISHSDPTATIIYTLDGSDPHLDNIGGVTYNYKVSYPQNPGDPFGELLQNTLETFTYTNPIQIVDRSNDPNKTSAISTTYFNEPYIPQAPVFKSTVVKARAIVDSEYSDIMVRNYFVTPEGVDKYTLPIVSLNIDADKYYSYENGLNVAGINFDQWRINNPTTESDIWTDANYWASGSESELRLNFSYIENGVEILNHDAGIRNHGNGSRHIPNRSVRLYAKGGYGVSKFNHSFFNDYDYDSFKRIIIRNSGNDAYGTLFRDAFIHQSTKHLNYEIQDYQPIILFVNSEYSGIYNIRERYDENYFDRVFGIDEDELDFMEFADEAIVDIGDSVHYDDLMDYLENNSLSDNTNFEYVSTLIDPINYADYYITNVFSANSDWPWNNNEFFRKRVSYTPNAPHGQDGRWRWLLKDLDFGYNLFEINGNNHNTLDNATKFYLPDYPEADIRNQSTLLIRKLLENTEYKNYFINRFADLLNTTFTPSRAIQLITDMEAVIAPEIEEHIQRWGMFSYSGWIYNLNVMKSFAQERPAIQHDHIMQKFDIDGTVTTILDVSDQNHGHIKINTIDILSSTVGVAENPYPWTGIYFENIPVTITAVPAEGYVFSHWVGTVEGDENAQLIISPESSIYAKAIFVLEDSDATAYDKSLNIQVFPNPFNDTIYIISEQYGFNYSVYSIDGKQIKNGVLNSSTLDLGNLQEGMYLLKIQNKESEITKKIIKK